MIDLLWMPSSFCCQCHTLLETTLAWILPGNSWLFGPSNRSLTTGGKQFWRNFLLESLSLAAVGTEVFFCLPVELKAPSASRTILTLSSSLERVTLWMFSIQMWWMQEYRREDGLSRKSTCFKSSDSFCVWSLGPFQVFICERCLLASSLQLWGKMQSWGKQRNENIFLWDSAATCWLDVHSYLFFGVIQQRTPDEDSCYLLYKAFYSSASKSSSRQSYIN